MSCRITGLPNKSYNVGDKLTTETEKRSIALSNSNTVVNYNRPDPSSEYTPIHMHVLSGGQWRRALSTQYGCWAFFVVPIERTADEVEIIENSTEAVEIAIRWYDIPLNVPYLNNLGVIYKDYTSAALIYPENSASPRYLTNIDELVLSVRVEKDYQGVFLGWHSSPKISPEGEPLKNNIILNEETSYQERELGTGSGSTVVWSSGGHISRHPAWGQKSEWTTAEATLGTIDNHAAWCLIDDPTYLSYSHAAYIPTQTAGYPKVQTNPPWWVADISSTLSMCRYIAMRKPIETGVWQYAPYNTEGSLVCHFCNEWIKPNGQVFPFQIFLGAFYYLPDSTNGYANEPKQIVKDEVYKRISELNWPGEPKGYWK